MVLIVDNGAKTTNDIGKTAYPHAVECPNFTILKKKKMKMD